MEYDSYRKAITPHIDSFKSRIKCRGRVIISIKDVRRLLGDDFADKHNVTIYSRVKDILLENGIKVTMGHNGNRQKLLIMKNAKHDEIITTADAGHKKRMITSKNQGLTASEYANKLNYATKYLGPESENKDCSRYFGNYMEKKYVMQIFEDPIPFEYEKDKMGRIIDRTKPYDYICKKGLKIKHIASCIRTDKLHVISCFGDPLLYWEYLIKNNNVPDYYILSAWNDRDSLEPLYVWIIRGDEIFITQRSQKPFWDRSTFAVYDTRKGIDRMSKYEATNRLEQLREICRIARKKE